MKISKERFQNISDVVKLSYTEKEEKKLTKDLNQLIEFIDTMNEMNTDNEEPQAYIHSQKNIYREDLPSDMISEVEELHANAPESIDGYYVVPRILE